MTEFDTRHRLTDMAALDAIYGAPIPASIRKEVDHIHPHYRKFIEAAPFAVLACGTPKGMSIAAPCLAPAPSWKT